MYKHFMDNVAADLGNTVKYFLVGVSIAVLLFLIIIFFNETTNFIYINF